MINWLNKINLKKLSIGIIIGGAIGFAYYYFIGCKSGTCAITSSPVNSTLYGVLLGALWTFSTKKGKYTMNYGYQRQINQTFENTEKKLRQTLADEGFGVITEIDVKNTFDQKLNIGFKKYKILGACEPNTAYKALSMDDQIGLLLPCNIVIWENIDQSTTVSAINSKVQLSISGIRELEIHADQINKKLESAVDKI